MMSQPKSKGRQRIGVGNVLVGDLRKLGDIQDDPGRIRDSFTEHALRIRTERLLYLRRGGIRIHEREFDSDLLERDSKEIERAAVDLCR